MLNKRENFAGSKSKTVSRARGSRRVETNPAGLCNMMVSRGARRTSFPFTLTWSRGAGCTLKSVQVLPLMVIRPASINSSQCRRDPRPAAARKRLRRTVVIRKSLHREPPSSLNDVTIQRFTRLHVRLRLWQTDHFLTALPLAAFLEKLNALEAF